MGHLRSHYREMDEAARAEVENIVRDCLWRLLMDTKGEHLHDLEAAVMREHERAVGKGKTHAERAKKRVPEPSATCTVVCPPGTEFILPGYQQAVSELLAAVQAAQGTDA